MRCLIVTGDDFGAHPGVNAAIAHAHDEGILTGASLLVTGEFASQAVVLARERPHLATGLHLALCDATPASLPAAIPDLVTRDGRFPASPARTASSAALRSLPVTGLPLPGRLSSSCPR